MARSTDFNIREALKRTRTQLLSAQESGRAALAGYEELAPQYNRAVERARNFQSTLTRDYDLYVQDRKQAVDTYNQQLQQRLQTYQGTVQRGAGLERSFLTAQQGLKRLQDARDAAATEVNRRYQVYADNYQTVVRIGSKEYGRLLKSHRDNMNLSAYQANKAAAGSFTRELKTREYEKFKKLYEDLQADTGYVQRFAEQQTATILRNYQEYLQNTYNPTNRQLNQFTQATYNPAAQAVSAFRQSDAVSQARTSYENLAQDTGFVDRAASDTKAVYDASQEEYGCLQAAYEGMAPQLNQYTQQAEAAKQQVLTLAEQEPGLQRSLAIDTEARKRGTRRDYRRSVLTGDFKRRGSAR